LCSVIKNKLLSEEETDQATEPHVFLWTQRHGENLGNR